MNARLIDVSPDALRAHTETYTQLCRIMLHAAGEISNLHFSVMKSSLASARQHFESIDGQDPATWLQGGFNSLGQASRETAKMINDISSLGASSLQQVGSLMGKTLAHDVVSA